MSRLTLAESPTGKQDIASISSGYSDENFSKQTDRIWQSQVRWGIRRRRQQQAERRPSTSTTTPTQSSTARSPAASATGRVPTRATWRSTAAPPSRPSAWLANSIRSAWRRMAIPTPIRLTASTPCRRSRVWPPIMADRTSRRSCPGSDLGSSGRDLPERLQPQQGSGRRHRSLRAVRHEGAVPEPSAEDPGRRAL